MRNTCRSNTILCDCISRSNPGDCLGYVRILWDTDVKRWGHGYSNLLSLVRIYQT